MNLLELMLALSLGSLIAVSVFHLFGTMEYLHQRDQMVASMQEKTRFITQFLRDRVHMAGNDACMTTHQKHLSHVIERMDANDAARKLGLTIKPNTDLLQVKECVRFHSHFTYLPIELYVANTARKTATGKTIDALFYKIAHHPREELVTGLIDFHVQTIYSKNHICAVRIDYLLSPSQPGVLTIMRGPLM